MKYAQRPNTATKAPWEITLEDMGYTLISYLHNTRHSDNFTYISNGVNAVLYKTTKGLGFFEGDKDIPEAHYCELVTPDVDGLVEMPETGARIMIDPLKVDPSRMYLDNGQRNYDRQHFIDETNMQVITAALPAPAVEQAPAPAPAPARVENFISFDRKVIVNDLLSKVPVLVDQAEVGHIACISVKGRHRVKAGFCNHKYTVIFNNGTEKDFFIADYRSHAEAYSDARKYAIHNAPAEEQAPAPAEEQAPAPVNTQEEEERMITLKRLSPAQLEIFSRAPHVTITGKHVTFEESNAPALITALEEMPGDQRTRMKCARRVKLATGQEVTIKKRAPAPSIPNTIKVRTSDAQRGVLQFINKRVCAGTIAAETVMHTFIHAGKVGEVITLLEDMHAMKVNTRACSSLIKTLEAHHVEQFTAAPLITAPAQDDWEEDEQFTIQFEETAARVHDPLHGLREVELPVTASAWGDAYTRVERTLNDYGYTPAGDRVTVARKHISGLLKQLELISVHGHINYDLEAALDDELAAWGAAVE